jgi:hypothetical protein
MAWGGMTCFLRLIIIIIITITITITALVLDLFRFALLGKVADNLIG